MPINVPPNAVHGKSAPMQTNAAMTLTAMNPVNFVATRFPANELARICSRRAIHAVMTVSVHPIAVILAPVPLPMNVTPTLIAISIISFVVTPSEEGARANHCLCGGRHAARASNVHQGNTNEFSKRSWHLFSPNMKCRIRAINSDY